MLEWVATLFSRGPWIKPGSPALLADSLPSEPPGRQIRWLQREHLNITKANYDKTTVNVILKGGKLKKVFPLKSEIREVCPLSPLLLNIVLEVLTTSIR